MTQRCRIVKFNSNCVNELYIYMEYIHLYIYIDGWTKREYKGSKHYIESKN